MAGYTRQSSFADGDTITAALFNDEYNQLVNAFNNSTGHSHDGTTAEGPVIGLIGDAGETSPNNKVLIDTTNNYIEFYIEVSSAPVQQLYIADGAIVPVTDNDIDLGTSSLEFKNLYLDGTATIDTLTVDEAATVGTTLGVTGATTLSSTLAVTGATTLSSTLAVTGATTLSSTLAVTGTSTLTGNVTTTNDLSVGGNLTVTGNATISGNLTFGDADTDSITLTADVASHITPDVDDTYDLGSSTKQWRNLYIDGTAEIDTLALDGTTVTSTAAELNILDGVTSTAAELNILDGVTSTTAELNILDGVTSTATEINLLDGATVTTAEINILDGGNTATSTTLADADRLIVNDAGTMVQVALTDFETYFESALDTLSNVTTVGALNSGSITSGFGSIDNGSSAITTTGTITYGSLSDGTITITAFVDEDDMSSDSATLVPTQQSVKAYVDSQVTAQDLDLTTDSGTIAIDLNSETLTIGGTSNEIETSATGNAVTIGIPAAAQITTSLGVGGGSTNGVQISQGAIAIKNGGTQSNIDFYCESSNAHYARLQAPAHSAFSGNVTLTLPAATGTLVGSGDSGTVSNTMLANSTVSFGGISLALGASDATPAFDLSDATNYPTSSLSGTISNAQLANSTVSFGGVSLALGASDATPAFDLTDATNYPTSSLTGTITNAQLAGSIANAKLANSSISVAAGATSTAIALGGTVTFAGTSNEIEVSESSGTVTYGLPNNVTISNDLTVSGNLTVSGTTTQTGPIVSDDNFTGLTNSNTGNSTDFGLYGKYVESSTTKYAGLFYDASTDNTFRLFADTQTEPAATVDTSATGYAAADLVVNNLTGTIATAAQTNITSVGTLSSLTVSGDVNIDSYTLKVDSTNNRVGIGDGTPEVSLDVGGQTDAIHVPVGTTAQRPTGANGYFRYNSDDAQFEGYANGAWGAIAGSGGGTAPSVNTMTGDGSTTTLSLSTAPVNENATFLTIDGVLQHKDTYSVAGSTLTFSAAPPNGTAVECIVFNTTTLVEGIIIQDADLDTKIQVEESTDEDIIRFDTAGTERMVINANGTVGIGTSGGSYALDLVTSGNNGLRVNTGTSSADQIYLGNTGGSPAIGTLTSDNLGIITGGSTRMTVGTNGDVAVNASARIAQGALTSSSNSVAWDSRAIANAYYATTENTTFAAPTNAVEGAIISVEIAQGSTAYTVAWNTVFEFAASTAPTVTATANKTDIFSFRYNGSVWQEIGRTQNLAQT